MWNNASIHFEYSINSAIFSTAYCPPIEYLLLFMRTKYPYVETKEHYLKQSYRNRCSIQTANGVLNLSVPVKLNKLHHCPIEAVRLDYSTPWQRTHWRALEAAYNASPFFLYYRDYLEPFFVTQEIETLLEFNQKLFNTLLKLFEINGTYFYTQHYTEEYPSPTLDLRNEISPKKMLLKNYPHRIVTPYRQVFSDRFGFTPNLSCVDLLFN
ncbi:MAG: WbqC family protein, partial [Lentimicrobiaceae bacterium]|nr:WbqC family protein [Lentimicrobiaceae bacterium]